MIQSSLSRPSVSESGAFYRESIRPQLPKVVGIQDSGNKSMEEHGPNVPQLTLNVQCAILASL